MNEIARAAYKAFLKAQQKTKAELLQMAVALEQGIDETVITSIGTEGASTSSTLSQLTKTDRLSCIMDVYQEGNGLRTLCSVLDRSGSPMPL